MSSRVLAVLAVASLVCALPVAAQRTGTIEVGGFARYVDFDNTLPMGDDMDIGGGGGGVFQPPGANAGGPARGSPRPGTHTPPHPPGPYHHGSRPRPPRPVRGGRR